MPMDGIKGDITENTFRLMKLYSHIFFFVFIFFFFAFEFLKRVSSIQHYVHFFFVCALPCLNNDLSRFHFYTEWKWYGYGMKGIRWLQKFHFAGIVVLIF